MRKHFLFAGILLAAALVFAGPSKADSVVNYSLTGPGVTATFSLPQTFTPSAMGTIVYVNNISGTLLSISNYTYGTIDLGLSGFMGVTNYWAFGSTGSPGHPGPELGLYVAGLFTVNADGTITLNGGTFQLGDYHLFAPFNGTDHPFTLTATVVNDTVGTPEPATLALLGIGGLALAGIRRRKSA